ncbi:hypothetical protein [Schlesneria sp. DSM 10557]|uniref:hypothetical protein n=1 Tax=Schlesneria sp. DSM 10557 TaxID=3044399 RepID=UPI0035A1A63C
MSSRAWIHSDFSFADGLLATTAALLGLVSGEIMSWQFVSELTFASAGQAVVFATLIGIVCGVTVRRHFGFCLFWFVCGFCVGEFAGLRPGPELGDTVQKFTLSVATLNLAPLVAACGTCSGHELQKLLLQQTSSHT